MTGFALTAVLLVMQIGSEPVCTTKRAAVRAIPGMKHSGRGGQNATD